MQAVFESSRLCFGQVGLAEEMPLAEPPTVVVLLTTSLHPLDLARAQQLPIAGMLTKPLTREKVAYILEKHVAQLR